MYGQSRKMRGVDSNRHGGGKPEGKEGDNNSPVRGRQPVLHSPSTPRTLNERLRTRRTLRAGVFEYDVSLSETEPEPQGGDYLSAEG